MNKRIKQFYKMRINIDEFFDGEYLSRFLRSYYEDSLGMAKSTSNWNDFYHKGAFHSRLIHQNDCVFGPNTNLDLD